MGKHTALKAGMRTYDKFDPGAGQEAEEQNQGPGDRDNRQIGAEIEDGAGRRYVQKKYDAEATKD
ncbi:MAG: hypothetical protein NVSMB42_10300 [Herpetosiphon sp.]